MNESVIAEAVKLLIDNNESLLLDGISYQGSQKSIHQNVTSTLTPPTGYPFILTMCSEVRETSKNERSNLQLPPRIGVYDMIVEVTEQALVVAGEEFPYKQMQDDFRLFTDRIVYIIKNEPWITYNGESAELQRVSGESGRRVTKRNLSGYWQDTEQNWWATLNCQILFSLVACIDDSSILPT